MIYTVTFNPSLDYFVTVNNLELGKTNRTSSEEMVPGGKGINVSILLSNLGIDSTALGFVAGFVGDEICRRIEDYGIKTKFIKIEDGCSRINVKVKNINGTEINGMGPEIPDAKLEELMSFIDTLKSGDVLVLAGSIPSSMPSDTYSEIMKRLANKDILSVVDATKKLLTNVLEYRPFLIKPNDDELGEIFGVTINDKSNVPVYAKKLQEMGARNVLVSMGAKGAVLVAENGEVYEADAPTGELKNAVGAGDSMVAGFIAGWLKNHSYEDAFKLGLAAGSASAFSDGFASEDEISVVLKRCEIRKM